MTFRDRVRSAHAAFATLVVASCFAWSPELQAQSAPRENPDAPAPIERHDQPMQKPGVAYTGMYLPDPILKQDAQWYARLLGLEGDAVLVAEQFFKEYTEEVRAVREQHERPLWDRASAVAAAGWSDPDAAAAYESLLRSGQQLVDRLRRIEVAYFAKLETLLPPDELQRMQRLRLDRQRAHAIPFRSVLGGATFDLTREVRGMEIPADLAQALDALMMEYEHAITPIMVRFTEDWIDQSIIGSRLVIEARFGPDGRQHDPNDADAQSRAREIHEVILPEMLKRRAREEERAFDVNRAFLRRFRDVLPPTLGESLVNRFRQQAYVNIYPDLEDATGVAIEALALEDLGDDQRERISAAAAHHRRLHDAYSTQMEDIYIPWRAKGIYRSGYNVAERDREYALPLLELYEKRLKANEALVLEVRRVLTEQQCEHLRALKQWDLQRKGRSERPWRPA